MGKIKAVVMFLVLPLVAIVVCLLGIDDKNYIRSTLCGYVEEISEAWQL